MCKHVTVGLKLSQPNLSFSFRRNPRGGIEKDQYDNLVDLAKDVTLNSTADGWLWDLEDSGVFTVSSIRNLIDEHTLPGAEVKSRWNNYVPIKVNIHTWKIMTNSLPTRFNISRRGIPIDSILCVTCDKGVETSSHLFFSCPMAQKMVNMITCWWSLPYSVLESFEDWVNWFDKVRLPPKNKKLLEGVFFVSWWCLWSFRNKIVFESKVPKKALLFDDVMCISFLWCRSRSKVSFGWNEWLKNPHLIVM